MGYEFNAQYCKEKAILWIRDYFAKNGPDAEAVIGISGGKDSTVAAALCVEALGKDRVVGLQLPNRVQSDIAESNEVIKTLDIKRYLVNIASPIDAIYDIISMASPEVVCNEVVATNMPARMRMLVLYCYANQHGARVCCTDNLSEWLIGYNTRWGDDIGDFAPLRNFTATEVIKIGETMSNIPQHLIHKVPHDGMCGQTDEERFGFTYAELDSYIRSSAPLPQEVRNKIEKWVARAKCKRQGMTIFEDLL